MVIHLAADEFVFGYESFVDFACRCSGLCFGEETPCCEVLRDCTTLAVLSFSSHCSQPPSSGALLLDDLLLCGIDVKWR